MLPFCVSVVINKVQYRIDVKYLDIADVQEILRYGFGEKTTRSLKLKMNSIHEHWKTDKFTCPSLKNKEWGNIYIVPDRFFEIEIPTTLCREDSASTYLSQSELCQTDSDVFLSLINSRHNVEYLGSLEERKKGLMVTPLLAGFCSYTSEGLTNLMANRLISLPRLSEIHYVFEDMIVHINYFKGTAKLMYFNNEVSDITTQDSSTIQQVLLGCKKKMHHEVRLHIEAMEEKRERVKKVGMSEREEHNFDAFFKDEAYRSEYGSLRNHKDFNCEIIKCKPCERINLKRPLILLALHHSIFLEGNDFETFLKGEISEGYLAMFVTKVKQMSLQYLSLILENEKVTEVCNNFTKKTNETGVDDEHVYLKSDICNDKICKDLSWFPNQVISLQVNNANFQADLGDGFSEADLLSISLYALYVNNPQKIPRTIPFIGGIGLIHAGGQIGLDLSNKKCKRKVKPIQIEELPFFKENNEWTWDHTKSFGFICPNRDMKHLVSVVLTLEKNKFNKRGADERIQTYTIKSKVYDAFVKNSKKAIEQVPKGHKRVYEMSTNKVYYKRIVKSCIAEQLKNRSRGINGKQITCSDNLTINPSIVYQWDDDDHSCGVSAVIHQVSQMFMSKEFVEEVGGISERFKTVAEYKKTMYALFVCAAYEFLNTKEFKGYNYLDLPSCPYANKAVKNIKMLSSQQTLVENILKSTENLETKVGKELLSLFHFLGETITHDQVTTVNENSKKGISVSTINENSNKKKGGIEDSIVTGNHEEKKLKGTTSYAVDISYDDSSSKGDGTSELKKSKKCLEKNPNPPNGSGTKENKESKDSWENISEESSEYKKSRNDDASVSSDSVKYHLGNNFSFK